MSSAQGFMRIGEVHTLLRKDFPDIELSKIRYYEDKGLVQPSRSRKGYRLYSEADVDTLREAIRLAQDEFVPLRVVRLRLIEQGLLSADPIEKQARRAARTATALSVTAAVPERVEVIREVPAVRVQSYYSHSEFMQSTRISDQMLQQLIALGLIVPERNGRETAYTQHDVEIATYALRLVERGVDLRLLSSLRRVAEREVGIIDDVTQPLRRSSAKLSEDEIQMLVGEVVAEMSALRSVLFERALAQYLSK